jgi:hypothetical protein
MPAKQGLWRQGIHVLPATTPDRAFGYRIFDCGYIVTVVLYPAYLRAVPINDASYIEHVVRLEMTERPDLHPPVNPLKRIVHLTCYDMRSAERPLSVAASALLPVANRRLEVVELALYVKSS